MLCQLNAHCVPNQRLQAFIFLCGEAREAKMPPCDVKTLQIVPPLHVVMKSVTMDNNTQGLKAIMYSKKIQTTKMHMDHTCIKYTQTYMGITEQERNLTALVRARGRFILNACAHVKKRWFLLVELGMLGNSVMHFKAGETTGVGSGRRERADVWK